MIIGVIEDNGRLFGCIKLKGEGGRVLGDISVGTEKSPISLFNTMPVELERTPPPNG